MKLTRVTITGADDGVDPMHLADFSRRFPFVEWGLLGSLKREGESRYPSKDWVQRLKRVAPASAQLSHHLCGELARRALSDQPSLVSGYTRARRVQVNALPTMDLFKTGFLDVARRYPETEIILQAGAPQSIATVLLLADEAPNVVCLFDPSRGTGKHGDWRIPTPGVGSPRDVDRLRLGWAGGINPSNVVHVIQTLLELPRAGEFWIDVETGVRSAPDRFDLEKVLELLTKASSFIGVEGKPPRAPNEKPRGLVRSSSDEVLFVGLLEFVSKQPCTCLRLPEKEKPCIVCEASTRKAEIEHRPELPR